MPPLDAPCVTTTVTHTITKTVSLTASLDFTTTKTLHQTKTTTLSLKGNNATGYPNVTLPKNASFNGTVPYNTPPKGQKTSTDNKCGAKVGRPVLAIRWAAAALRMDTAEILMLTVVQDARAALVSVEMKGSWMRIRQRGNCLWCDISILKGE
jgi:hypothetical protein